MKNYLNFFILIFLFSCTSSDDKLEILLPTIAELNFSIQEYPTKGVIIGDLNLPSEAKNYQISILNQNPTNSFSVNSFGKLIVENQEIFDYDINKKISGKIKVKVKDEEIILNVDIEVLDVYKIFNGNVDIYSQVDLDVFALNKYDEINGNVSLVNNDIKNIDGFYSLKKSNTIFIAGTDITNLNGLKNLVEISNGGIVISSNNKLQNIEGFQSLETSGYIEISSNSILENIEGFKNLIFCKKIMLTFNDNLTNITGFNSINDNMSDILIEDNKKLENLSFLLSIKTLSSSLRIIHNQSLNNLNGLSSISTIKSLDIRYNRGLIDFCGLSNFFTENPNFRSYLISDNAYNPNSTQIKSGSCTL